MADRRVLKRVMAIVVFALVGAGVYLRNVREVEPGLADLPEGVIARTSAFRVMQSDLDAFLAALPENQRQISSNDLEGALEELIESTIFLAEARKLPEESQPDLAGKNPSEVDRLLLDALKAHAAGDVKASEAQIRSYYEEHRSEYEGQPGGSYEEMRESIAGYLQYDLLDEAFDRYRKSLVERADVKKDRGWVIGVRAKLKDPLAQARASGKVVIADFGRGI